MLFFYYIRKTERFDVQQFAFHKQCRRNTLSVDVHKSAFKSRKLNNLAAIVTITHFYQKKYFK